MGQKGYKLVQQKLCFVASRMLRALGVVVPETVLLWNVFNSCYNDTEFKCTINLCATICISPAVLTKMGVEAEIQGKLLLVFENYKKKATKHPRHTHHPKKQTTPERD